MLRGYFPDGLPVNQRNLGRDLVVCRHVLEHIESPVPFMRALADTLLPDGELWIEVPDLSCTLEREIWSNFYQLHCNYFSAATLDHLAGKQLSGEKSMLETALSCAQACGLTDADVVYNPRALAPGMQRSVPDTSKIDQELGITPLVPLEKGLATLREWIEFLRLQ